MMNRFFRAVWRINAVLICLAAVLVSFVCAVAAYYIIREESRPSTGHYAASVEEPNASPSERNWRILEAGRIAGTRLVRCEFSSQDDPRRGGFSKGDVSATRNYVYYDLDSGATRWLLPSSHSLIINREDFYFPDSPSPDRIVRWTAFTVVDNDTNHDKQLSASDLLAYAVSRTDGTGYTVLLNELDEILEASLAGEFDLVVFYRKTGESFVCRVDLKQMKVISTTTLFDGKGKPISATQ